MTQQIIREAIVIDVDVKNQTCKLDYGDARSSEMSAEIPLPNMMGSGNNGLINIIKPNTRVLVAFVGIYGRKAASIIAVLPSLSQQNSVPYSSGLSKDLPVGSRKYPEIKEGEVILSSHTGPSLHLKEDREMSLTDIYDKGIYFNYYLESHSIENATNNIINYTSGGRSFFGEVRRNENFIINSDKNDILNYNKKILDLTKPVGFFPTFRTDNAPAGSNLRNPSLAEFRMVINEFSSDSQFSSFEDEILKFNKTLPFRSKNEKYSKYLDPTNLLGLSRKELIEIVSGNMIDINGLPLDINYNYIKMLDGEKSKPSDDESYVNAIIRSRRGIGHHFQLNTAAFNDNKDINLKNFVFDIDKEGVFKLHVPKTKETGNILYPSVVNYSLGEDNTITAMSPANKSKILPVPVMLRDKKGNPVPYIEPSKAYRSTGVRFANKEGYFKEGEKGFVRINKTKHHNIYEIAERLIANTIQSINIPTNYVQVNPDGTTKIVKDPEFLGYNYINRPFEVVQDRPNLLDKLASKLDDAKFDYAYSTLSVFPESPAIKTGGNTFFAGRAVPDSDKPQGNQYSSKINAGKISTEPNDKQQSAGGVSANIDFEGGIEVSVGSDDPDGKSITLDTAGSLVAWFGKDSNGRSIIAQTDGAVAFNIGGSYSGTSNAPILNKGRLDIRVNVNDRGFYADVQNQPEITESTGSTDYIISISENGIVIAGGTKKPMLLKNKGEIMIESETTVSLFGKEINFITPGREPVPFTKMSKNKQR
jgi:hypothetical protein